MWTLQIQTIVRVLLNHTQVDLHVQDRWGLTALLDALKRGHLAVAKLLLAEPRIPVNATDRNDVTPLWWTTRGNHRHVAARLLAEPKVDINAVGKFERPVPDRSTSHDHAVRGRSNLIIRLLLMEKSLDVNITDHQGWTPLGRAALQGDLKPVEWLLSRRDIQVNAVKQSEQSPLWLAARHGHIRVVQRLLECRDIDINQEWCGYLPPLLAAIIAGHTDVAMRLLACGEQPDINSQTYQKKSALSLAARYGRLQVVTPSYKTVGRTATASTIKVAPLCGGQTAVVKRLLGDANVQVDVKDRQGADAVDVARSKHHFGVIGLLRAYRVGYRRDDNF
jgi:ankyrin repeat protein